MGWGGIGKIISAVFNYAAKINPIVGLVISIGLAWLMRPKVPEIPDFGTNDFDNYEKGILLNKQSNDANIPVIYGTRMIGGTRVFMETSGTDNTHLYMAIILSEGEINDITSIKIDDKTVTWSGDLSDNVQRTVGSGDSNFYKDSASLITVEPHYGTDGQSASSLLSTLSSWGSTHKLSGLSYLALKFTWNQDAFTGIPKVQSIVQGKKVVAYTEGTDATTTLSANITATQDYIPVASTSSFTTTDEAKINNSEEVTFTGITTNLQVYSQDIDNAAWSKSRVTVAANSTTAPDGTTTADTLTTTTATGGHLIYDSLGSTVGAYAYSVYLKANASNFGFIGQYDGSNYNGIVVNLSTGAITDTSGSVTSSSVEDVGSGWYRLKCVKTFSTNPSYILIALSDSGTPSYTSGRPNFTGVDESIFVWGVQVEEASSVTGYLPTTSASLSGLTTVTRGQAGTTATTASSGQTVLQKSFSAQTAAYSDNPSWCLLDYLTNARYGKGLAIGNIDIPSFYTASGICDTDVTAYGSTTIDVMDCNAVIDTSSPVIDNVREFLKGCRGYLPYVGGKYKLIVETTGSSSITVTEDDIIGGYTLASPTKNSKYNRVIISYVNPSRNYQVDEVQFPEIDDSAYSAADKHAAMKTVDGGFLLEGRFDMKTITSPYQALELAEVILRRSREALGLTINVSFSAYDVAIGDILGVTHSSLGFTNKQFRILGINFNADFTLGLDLMQHEDSHYTWATKTQVSSTPSTNLPNPYTIQPPASVTLDDELIEYNDGTVIVALNVTVGASTDKFVDYYQVEYKLSTDSDYIIYAQGSGLNHRVLNVIDQKIYDVRVKAVNAMGVSSTYVTATRTIIGAIEPPQDVEDFACNILGQEAHLSWTQVPDLDLAYYQIRYSSLTNGNGDWANSVSLVEKVSRPATSINVPARIGTYLLKAVDKLGNFSSNATAIISNVTGVQNFNNITSVSEHPDFDGTLTNTAIVDDTLRLDSSELFDAAAGNFDTETTRFFDSGVANADFYASGNYLFADVVDIGAKHTCRLTASLTQTSDDPDDLFDNRTGLFDSASSAFDGDTPSNSNAHIEISTSDDNSTYTAFQNFVIGNYTARYFKFRVVLTSSDLASTPVVEEVSITIDMEDRIFSGNDITSGATTKTVSFTNPYKTVNYAVGITGQGMATGDFFLVESKTINGFNVTFKNSGGTSVSKTFDYIAKGY